VVLWGIKLLQMEEDFMNNSDCTIHNHAPWFFGTSKLLQMEGDFMNNSDCTIPTHTFGLFKSHGFCVLIRKYFFFFGLHNLQVIFYF